MSWQRTMRGVPHLHSYERALKEYNSIDPLKSGRNKGIRPVGDRRKVWEKIMLMPDQSVRVAWEWSYPKQGTAGILETYVGLEVVYDPNGEDVRVKFSTSSSALGFIGQLLGFDLNQRNNKLWAHGVWAERPDTRILIKGSFQVNTDTKLHFKRIMRDGYAQFQLVGPLVWPTQRKVDRKAANVVRKRYDQLRKYVRGVIGVNGGVAFSKEQLEAAFGGGVRPPPLDTLRNKDNVKVMLEKAGYVEGERREVEPDQLFNAAVWVIRATLHQDHPTRAEWRGERMFVNDLDTLAKDRTHALSKLDLLLFAHHADEVYYNEPSYEGRVV